MEPNTLKNTTFEEWSNLSLDDCIERGVRECNPRDNDIIDSQLAYFCGQGLKCVQWNNKQGLIQAKENVEKYFPVVAVLEYLGKSLKVMEETLPRFFEHITSTYAKSRFINKI